MLVWRISKYATLEGRGGLAASGRWHTKPKPIVYCADTPHTAYLEVLKPYVLPALMPDDLLLVKIDCHGTVEIEEVTEASLDPLWHTDAHGPNICRPIGDEWLRSGRTALLKVPSAANRGSFNFLINPSAYKAHLIDVAGQSAQPFDTSVVSGDQPSS